MNVKSVFFFVKESFELLRLSKDGGSVLVTSSLSGVMPGKMVGVYAMSKASIINMVKWLSQELIDQNIRINAIAPGFTRTNMVKDELELGFDKYLPKKALADAHEVASVACLICS